MTGLFVERVNRLQVRLQELGVPNGAAVRLANALIEDGWVFFGDLGSDRSDPVVVAAIAVEQAARTVDELEAALPCPCLCFACTGGDFAPAFCQHEGVSCEEARR